MYFYIPTNYTCVCIYILRVYIIQKPTYPYTNFCPFLLKMKNAALPRRTGSQPHAGQLTHGLNPQTESSSQQGLHLPARTPLVTSLDGQGGTCCLEQDLRFLDTFHYAFPNVTVIRACNFIKTIHSEINSFSAASK